MKSVLAAERVCEVQSVKATKAETQRQEAQSRFETQRLEFKSLRRKRRAHLLGADKRLFGHD
jgi:hypothetical protein